jgi:cytochrome c-type biogenesis protein
MRSLRNFSERQARGEASTMRPPPAASPRRRPVLALIVALGSVGLLLGVLAAIRNSAESAIAGIAGGLPFGWAYAAGAVASVNPCGFFMLPAYLSYQLASGPHHGPAASGLVRALQALMLGLAATLGFITVMAAAGLVIGATGQRLVRAFPYAGILVGAGLAALGGWLLVTHRSLGIVAASRLGVTPRWGLTNVFLFGVAYAVGSLSCTLPIFLLVAGTALSAGSLAGSVGQFMSFGLGMGTVLIVITIGLVFFQGAVSRSLRRLLPHVHRTSALFLIGAGAYLVYYWAALSGLIL